VSKCNYSNKIGEVISLAKKYDKRKWKQISVKDIIELTTISILQGNASLLSLDLNGRNPEIKKVFNITRNIVISDTHLERMFSTYLLDMENVAQDIFFQNRYSLSAAKGLRTLIIDGTMQGKHLCVVAAINGKTPFFVGLESQKKRGKELVAADRLIERLPDKIYEYLDLIVGDGLYFSSKVFNQANRKGVDLFVKSKEVSLNIIEDIDFCYKVDKEILTKKNYIEGYDLKRGCKYSIFKMEGYVQKGVDKPLTYYRVEEHYSKNARDEIFYCLTTATHLTPKQAREIAKSRWQIENNVFRNGSQQVKTKHKLFNSASTTKNYLSLIYLLMSILWLQYVTNSENLPPKCTFENYLRSQFTKFITNFYTNLIFEMNSS